MAKILISHPFGNANTRGLLNGLANHNMLYKYVTSVALFKTSWWYKFTALSVLKEFRKRVYSEKLKCNTKCFPFKELSRQIALKFKFKSLISPGNAIFSPFSCSEYIDNRTRHILRKNDDEIDVVYCYGGAAIHTFSEAKRLGKITIFDLTAGYWRYNQKLIESEKRRNPDWGVTINSIDYSEGSIQLMDEELRLADKIYVASTFTKKTLELYPTDLADIEIVPYGFPPVNKLRKYEAIGNRKIKLLYVGSLSQMKGLSYLFEAMEGLEEYFELTIVGRSRSGLCPALECSLKKHNYIGTLPHDEVLRVMSTHDIFVFPSLSDGFGLVLTEAMSQGTPCIATEQTCAPDIFHDGKDGWIVEAGSSNAIKEKLLYLLSHKDEIASAGKEAMKAAERRPWKCYEDDMVNSIMALLNN